MTGEDIMTGKELLHKVLNVKEGNLFHDLMETMLQILLEAERDEHVGAGRYEQTAKMCAAGINRGVLRVWWVVWSYENRRREMVCSRSCWSGMPGSIKRC